MCWMRLVSFWAFLGLAWTFHLSPMAVSFSCTVFSLGSRKLWYNKFDVKKSSQMPKFSSSSSKPVSLWISSQPKFNTEGDKDSTIDDGRDPGLDAGREADLDAGRAPCRDRGILGSGPRNTWPSTWPQIKSPGVCFGIRWK